MAELSSKKTFRARLSRVTPKQQPMAEGMLGTPPEFTRSCTAGHCLQLNEPVFSGTKYLQHPEYLYQDDPM
jgi:hypothetical protein